MKKRIWSNKYKHILKAILDYKEIKISIGRLAEILEISIDDTIDFIRELGLIQKEPK